MRYKIIMQYYEINGNTDKNTRAMARWINFFFNHYYLEAVNFYFLSSRPLIS